MKKKDILLILLVFVLVIFVILLFGYIGGKEVIKINGTCDIGFYKFCYKWSKVIIIKP